MPRPVLFALFGVYLVALALIGFWPTTVDKGVEGQLWELTGWAYGLGFTFVTYELIERLANIVLFVPFGLLLASLLPRGRRGWGIAIAVLASVGIELGQLLFLPGRYPSLSDVITNSTGATIGVVVMMLLLQRRERRARDAALVAEAIDSRYRSEHPV